MHMTKPTQIINVPLDLGASRRGTDAGPSALRIAGLNKALTKIGIEVSGESDIQIPTMESLAIDTPNVKYKKEILQVCRSLASQVFETMQKEQTPLVIGGDHSIAMGTISGLAKHFQQKGERLGVIWFDAHGDMNLPSTSPTGNIHGMPLAHLLGYGDNDLSSIMSVKPALKAEDVVLIGLRDIDPIERGFINSSGVTAFTMRDIDQLGMQEVIRRALEIANRHTTGFHLSFDLDGCDPEVIPGTGTKVSGGASLRETHLLLEECALDGRMTSMEVVELNPFLDKANVSAERAVNFVQSAYGRSIL